MSEQKQTTICTLKIKYDDLVAGEHTIPLLDLGKSLSGFASALNSIGTYALSGNATSKQSQSSVIVTTEARPHPGSFEILATIATLQPLNDLLESANHCKSIFCGICSYLFGSKREKADMEVLCETIKSVSVNAKETIEKALDNNKDVAKHALEENKEVSLAAMENNKEVMLSALKVATLKNEELVASIKSLETVVQTACKNAVSPIDLSCATIHIYSKENDKDNPYKEIAKSDKNIKRLINIHPRYELIDESNISIVFYSMNKITGKCQFVYSSDIENDLELDLDTIPHFNGEIRDPEFEVASNTYTKSFDSGEPLEVQIKTKKMPNGEKFYYIMGAVSKEKHEAE